MVLSVEQKLKLRNKLARRKASSQSGESTSPACQLDCGMGGGDLSVSSVPSAPLCFGTELVYVAIPSLVCLAPIGANGYRCCLNTLPCSIWSHKHPCSLDVSNPFFIELVTKSDATTHSSAVKTPRGGTNIKLPVNGTVEEKFIVRLLEESSDNWPGRFSQLENGDSNLSLNQLIRADKLLLTVVKHRPVDVQELSDTELIDSTSLAEVESKLKEIFDEDDDLEDAEMDANGAGNTCCVEMSGCDCFEKFKRHNEKHSETQHHLTELGAKVALVLLVRTPSLPQPQLFI